MCRYRPIEKMPIRRSRRAPGAAGLVLVLAAWAQGLPLLHGGGAPPGEAGAEALWVWPPVVKAVVTVPSLEPPARLLVCDSSLDAVLVLADVDRNGFVDRGEVGVFYDGSSPGPDLSTPSHLAPGPEGKILLLDGGTLDAILALEDLDGDGDANDEGEVTVFYDASSGGPALFTPNSLVPAPDGSWYVTDDSTRARRIVRLVDLDGDGTALGPQEARVVYDANAASEPLLEDMESLAIAPSGTIYAADATLGAIFVLEDEDGDGLFLGADESRPFFSGRPDLPVGDVESLVWAEGVLYACDKAEGRVLRLVDTNGDGDAEDEGETTVYLDATTTAKPAKIVDAIALEEGLLLLDNTTDGVFVAIDLNGDGDALDDGEVFPWLLDGGATLSLPSGLLLVRFEPTPPPPPPPERTFIRGDATADGEIDISDGIATLNYLFLGGVSGECADAMDADDSGEINISDGIYTLNYLFRGAAAPAPPFPEPGPDPTPDLLDC